MSQREYQCFYKNKAPELLTYNHTLPANSAQVERLDM